MKCNSNPVCMFFMPHRDNGCSKKNKHLKRLTGCEHHHVYSRDNYDPKSYKRYGTRNDPIDWVVLKRLAEEGLVAKQIMERMGCVRSTIRYTAIKHNIKITPAKKGGDYKSKQHKEATNASIKCR